MKTNICSYPDCAEEGTFPAPRNPKDIYDRQYFCKEHIIAFNKKWDGLKGMSEDDIFSMQTKSTWERPTWAFGTQSKSGQAAGFQFNSSDDLYAFFKQRQKREYLDSLKFGGAKEERQEVNLPPDVKEACSILNIELPIDEKKLKVVYVKLIKKHHPDKNAGAKDAEELMTRINVAHQIIKDFIENQ